MTLNKTMSRSIVLYLLVLTGRTYCLGTSHGPAHEIVQYGKGDIDLGIGGVNKRNADRTERVAVEKILSETVAALEKRNDPSTGITVPKLQSAFVPGPPRFQFGNQRRPGPMTTYIPRKNTPGPGSWGLLPIMSPGVLGKLTLPEPRDQRQKRSINQYSNSKGILKKGKLIPLVWESQKTHNTFRKRSDQMKMTQFDQWQISPFLSEPRRFKRNDMDIVRRTIPDSLNRGDKRDLEEFKNSRKIIKRQKLFYHVAKDGKKNPVSIKKPEKDEESLNDPKDLYDRKEEPKKFQSDGWLNGHLFPPPFVPEPIRFKRNDMDIVRRTLLDSLNLEDRRDLKRYFPHGRPS